MHKCEQCDREFKSKSGLSRHIKSCQPEEVTVEVTVNEVASDTKELSDNIIRKINKLKDARKSTWDAESRHNIDLKIAELQRGN